MITQGPSPGPEWGDRQVRALVAEWELGLGDDLMRCVIASARQARGLPAQDDPLPTHLAAGAQDLLAHDDVLGRVYQALRQKDLRAAYRGTTTDRRKFADHEIPAVTQLFTPGWVVEFLVQNTLGQTDAAAPLRPAMPWLVPAMPSTTTPLRSLRLIDPACGTGNFLLVAFDWLCRMYRAQDATLPDRQIAEAILRDNLYGVDIDPAAIDLAREALAMKAGLDPATAATNLRVGDGLEGEPAGPFDVVVTNPPYLSARNLDPARVRWLKRHYPAAYRDLYTCFIVRANHLLRPGGRAGLLTMQSFMFTASFRPLRDQLARQSAAELVVRMGPGLFDGGNPGTLQTACVVWRSAAPAEAHPARTFDLSAAADKQAALQTLLPTPGELTLGPRNAWIVGSQSWTRDAFKKWPRLGDLCPVRQGLATTDNARFVRYWWEVDDPAKWVPYAKGNGHKKWWAGVKHLVNWADNGREIKEEIVKKYPYLNGDWGWVAKNEEWYGREGVTWSYLTSEQFSARVLPQGCIFDVAASAMFPAKPMQILGLLNTRVAAELLRLINPTINFQVGDLAELPVAETADEVDAAVRRAVEIRQWLDGFDETNRAFVRPASPEDIDGRAARLGDAEWEIERMVADAYGVPAGARGTAKVDFDPGELAKRWVSYAVGRCFGRWGGNGRPELLEVGDLAQRVILELGGMRDKVERDVGGVERFLGREFFEWHAKAYAWRPIYWRVRNGTGMWYVPCWAATREVLSRVVEVPSGWERVADDGIAVNMAPLVGALGGGELARKLRDVLRAMREGRYGWSRIAQLVAT